MLDRLLEELKISKIVCKTALLDRYFFTVPVIQWLKKHELPFIIPVVVRGRKPKPGKKTKGLRACRSWKAGLYEYTHYAGKESVDFCLAINYKSYQHRRNNKRGVKKIMFATWKVKLTPTQVREAYRRRFGIETSYRQLNQSRSRTSSRDPLYRCLLVGLSLFLRNLWQWLVQLSSPPMASKNRSRLRKKIKGKHPTAPRYQAVLDDYSQFLQEITQNQEIPTLTAC